MITDNSSSKVRESYIKLIKAYESIYKGEGVKDPKTETEDLKKDFDRLKGNLFKGETIPFEFGKPIDKDTEFSTKNLKDLI